MSVQDRPYYDPRNRYVENGQEVFRCCENKPPYLYWRQWVRARGITFDGAPPIETMPQDHEIAIFIKDKIRREEGRDPNEIRCPGCATALEILRDDFAEAGPLFLRAIATVASFVPGIGTGVATAFGAAASLAEGNSIDQIMIDAALAAVPAGAAFQTAGAVGKSLLEGDPLDRALLEGARELARSQGGELAAAAFDAVVAISQGKALQDAGFAGLKSLAKGNNIAERAANYAETITRAAQGGVSVQDMLTSELARDLDRAAGVNVGRNLDAVVERVRGNLELLNAGSESLGAALAVPEAMARAAQSVLRAGDGSVDADLLRALKPPIVLGRVDLTGYTDTRTICQAAGDAERRGSPAAVSLRRQCEAYRASLAPVALGRVDMTGYVDTRTICEAALDAERRGSPAAPTLKRQCEAWLASGGAAPPKASPPAEPVRASSPVASSSSSSSSSNAGALAAGGVVAVAAVGLFLWATKD